MARTGHHLVGRLLGLLVFLIGIAILIWVFYTALGIFTGRVPGVFPTGSTGGVTADTLGIAAFRIIVELALLFLMCLVGSLIASRGVHLFLASAAAETDSKSTVVIREDTSE